MKRPLVVGVVMVLASASANGQLVTDQVPRERTVPRSEDIRRQMATSRYRLGVIRLRPIFALRDSGYDNNVFGTATDRVKDWRSTVSAGADLILPLGRKVYVTGIANPQYTYYNKLANRRLLGGLYGGSFVGLFNRLSMEAGGTTAKTIAPVNSENERSVPGNRRNAFARGELEFVSRLFLFASAEQQRQQYELMTGDPTGDLDFSRLERDETFVRAGLRYSFRSYLDIGIAEERGRTEFVSNPQTNNMSRATLLNIHYDRPRFFLNLSGGTRRFEPRGALSTLPSASTATGSYYAAYQLAAPLAVDAYGHRSAVYSLNPSSPYFYETRNALGLTLPVGQRIGLRAFAEIGTNAYPFAAPGAQRRLDDVTSLGGGVSYRIYRKATLTVVGSNTRYDSNFPELSRSLFRVSSLLSFGGETVR
jgi:hypothetical protein